MNKVLHVLVYVFLALAAAALYFEMQLNAKRTLLTDRNRLQEDYLVKLARTVEKADPAKDAAFEIKKDNSPVEARLVDSPDMENVLEEYPATLEQANLETYNWDNQREGLRRVYVTDADGNPVMDGNQPQTRDSDEYKMLEKLFDSAKKQQERLNSTRAALADLRGKLESIVGEINKIKPEARQDKVTIEEQKAKMSKLEEEKTGLESQITKIKSQTDELNGEITSVGKTGQFNVMTISAEDRQVNEGQSYTSVHDMSYVCAFGSTDFATNKYLEGKTYGNNDVLLSTFRTVSHEVDPVGIAFVCLYDDEINADATTDAYVTGATIALVASPIVICLGLCVCVMVRRKFKY